MTPFTISVSDEMLDDLHERLARVRFPDQLSDVDWDYGTDLDYMQELVEYWRDVYDWRIHETELNRLDHYTMPINNLRLHFIHQRSPHPDALPLILTHGWPGSVYEFMQIIHPLTHPEEHGGKIEDAFHVVCPSMPGYGYSEAPRTSGFNIEKVAATNVKLMEKLGYARYGAQGGDWGAPATAWTAYLAPKNVCGIHLNMALARPPKDRDNPPKLTEEEVKRIEAAKEFVKKETAYQQIQGTKPQTLGYGLSDSPVGLAAWIVEKFRSWSDCNGDIESRFTKDQLLTNIMIYWTTNTITSSTRLYLESQRAHRFGPPGNYVETPTACAIFPKELTRLPRAWAEESFNITQWTEMPQGGHFAAMEEPKLLIEDIRDHFCALR